MVSLRALFQNAALAVAVLPAYVAALLRLPPPAVRCFLAVACKAALCVCGLRPIHFGSPTSEVGATGRPCVLLVNHASSIDCPVVAAVMPLTFLVRTMVPFSAHLLRLPLVGRLMTGCAYPALRFREASFQVEGDAANAAMKAMERHAGACGGACAWFPEGTIHGDPLRLKQFRAGGFAVPVRVDCEIWLLTLTGCRELWPPGGVMVGASGRPRSHLQRLCASSAKLCEGRTERQACLHLAELARTTMQATLDDLVSDRDDDRSSSRGSRI